MPANNTRTVLQSSHQRGHSMVSSTYVIRAAVMRFLPCLYACMAALVFATLLASNTSGHRSLLSDIYIPFLFLEPLAVTGGFIVPLLLLRKHIAPSMLHSLRWISLSASVASMSLLVMLPRFRQGPAMSILDSLAAGAVGSLVLLLAMRWSLTRVSRA